MVDRAEMMKNEERHVLFMEKFIYIIFDGLIWIQWMVDIISWNTLKTRQKYLSFKTNPISVALIV